jgi:hypothetical protein
VAKQLRRSSLRVQIPADRQTKENEKEYSVLNDKTRQVSARALAITITGIKSIMDKKIIERYGEEILSYRIRTARQKKRMVYEDFDKQLLALHREERILSRRKRNLGWEPLIPPVQKGWVRSFVLRDDVAQAGRAQFFAGILEKINTHVYSHRKDFKVKKRRMGRRTYVSRKQQLMEPWPYQFNRMKFTEEERSFFQMVENMPDKKGHVSRRYVFREPWRFVLRVKPNIVGKVRVRDVVIEQRLTGIRGYLRGGNHIYRQLKLLYGYNINNRRFCKEPYYDTNPIKNKTLRQILEEAKEEVL